MKSAVFISNDKIIALCHKCVMYDFFFITSSLIPSFKATFFSYNCV